MLSKSVRVRLATADDLPAVQSLIRESFAALGDHYSPAATIVYASAADSAIASGDLSPEKFRQTYLDHSNGSRMWVAECEDAVVGCVALKHDPLRDEGELVRMAVSKSLRGGGVGQQLYAALKVHCRVLGVHRVHLMTANPNSASFYHRKCGFAILAEKPTVRGSSVFNVFHLAQCIHSSQLAG